MKKTLLYLLAFLLTIPALAQRTAEPVESKSNKIIAVFPDSLSAEQIYQVVGKRLVQQGYNIDSREERFGLLMAKLIDFGEPSFVSQDTLHLRIAVIDHEVTITGYFTEWSYSNKLKYNPKRSSFRNRWDKAIKVFEKLPLVRVEYEAVPSQW